MECLTDNLNRSASEVRSAVQKAGGKMADPGSVMFNFQRQGQVFVRAEASEDQVVTSFLHSQPCLLILLMLPGCEHVSPTLAVFTLSAVTKVVVEQEFS